MAQSEGGPVMHWQAILQTAGDLLAIPVLCAAWYWIGRQQGEAHGRKQLLRAFRSHPVWGAAEESRN